jgi:hypothetical protein
MWRGMPKSLGRLVLATTIAAGLTADDTTAIQSRLDTIGDDCTVYPGDREPIYFPPGTYRTTARLRVGGKVLRTHGTVEIGHGRDTRLVWDGPEDQPMVSANGLTYARYEGPVFDALRRLGEIDLRLNLPDMN